MAGGIGKEVFEAGVWMSVTEEQSPLVLIKWDQPRNDWFHTHDVMQQTSVRVAPLSGPARQDCAICSRVTQFFQSAMKAGGINTSNLVESIDNNAGRTRSFKDAGFDRCGAEACCNTCQQCSFSRPRFG
ncbi:hypothetical protein [Sagittula sp. MA-2]|uniref:hypothetical protein n=1 Tax=Sagittula sp. MA-2 TaxID=3048007 RepID=UPI0024C3C92C|nr:hypothetical protein [Sagittula sp. MA-2]WHZ36486.1 hypothetical protein QNI11_05605 [Sagittula sp. MA-2]